MPVPRLKRSYKSRLGAAARGRLKFVCPNPPGGFRSQPGRWRPDPGAREQAGGFGFIVAGCKAGPDGLLQQASAAAREIGTKLRISLTADVQTADEAAATAVTASLKTSDSVNAARKPTRTDRHRPRFTSSGADRRAAFLSRRWAMSGRSATGVTSSALWSSAAGPASERLDWNLPPWPA